VSPIESAAPKVAVSGAIIAVVLVRTRKLPREQLGLVRPRLGLSVLLVAVYLAWMLATDAAIHWRGPWDWRPWLAAPLAASAMRVLAVGILGPIAEELVFRGWFFGLLDKRIGVAATIAVTAVSSALLHYSYGWAVVGVIVVDGLLLGIARWKTRSVFAPIVMHALYNLYAVW
jgi:membrane protease YdiL (CAAX protease family)